ncbi:helix-turn-helix transcriptional regulator [Mesorhizobium sp. KR1-2]|uniref:helix-turn-helix domain-containing protein n=1 Tax=Mesorhizobium sp. KR1-2 TaxID=3156609 RepID=UPI0032B5CA2C
MNSKDFPFRLKQALKQQRITIQKLSDSTGIAVSTIKKWTGGYSEPTLSNLVMTAEALNVRIEWLAEGEGEMRRAATDPQALLQRLTAGLAARDPQGPRSGKVEDSRLVVANEAEQAFLDQIRDETRKMVDRASYQERPAVEREIAQATEHFDLAAKLSEEILVVYKAENARIAPLDLFNLAVEHSYRIMRFTPNKDRRLAMVATVIDEIREELRKPPTSGSSSKRRA